MFFGSEVEVNYHPAAVMCFIITPIGIFYTSLLQINAGVWYSIVRFVVHFCVLRIDI